MRAQLTSHVLLTYCAFDPQLAAPRDVRRVLGPPPLVRVVGGARVVARARRRDDVVRSRVRTERASSARRRARRAQHGRTVHSEIERIVL